MEYRGPDARAIKDLVDKHVAERTSELRQQLAECKVLLAASRSDALEAIEKLAECERERELYKVKAVIADMPMSEVEARLMKERDELVAALAHYATDESADGWVAIAALAKVGADKTGEGS